VIDLLADARLRRFSLQGFLVLTFFVYYQTIGLPGTLHSWALILGFTFTLPTLLLRLTRNDFRVPVDYALIGFMGVVMLIGFVANYGAATFWQLQAYLLGLVTYLFVRENMPYVRFEWFSRLMIVFLSINTALMILQFWTGGFFVARTLAAGDSPYLLPSGVSDGPTKNGMLQALALSYVFARLLWLPKSSLFEKALVAFGLGALILSGSRAGLLAFMMAAIGCAVLQFATRPAGNLPRKKRSGIRMFLVVTVLLGGIVRAVIAIPDLVNSMDVNYAANVLAYKLSLGDNSDATIEEGSVDTRFSQLTHAIRRIKENPVPVIGVGFGAGSFEVSEGLNMHNSYFEFLYEMGLVSLVALIVLTVWTGRRAFQRNSAEVVVPILTCLFSVMVFMMFHDVLRGRTFWIPLGMIGSLALARNERNGARA